MPTSNSSVPLMQLIVTFACLLVLGTIVTLPLYKFDWRKLVHSNLFIKIVFWFPIFIVFVSFLYMSNVGRLVLLGIILAIVISEVLRGTRKVPKNYIFPLFLLLFGICWFHLGLIGPVYPIHAVSYLIAICFAAVLSDVFAFFCGKYLGRHKLPAVINSKKTWEGVFGQLIGAFVGVLIVNRFIIPISTLWIFVPIGIGCATGDLLNSYVKRRAGIKDWGNSIPGHGGFLDRFASMAVAAFLVVAFLVVVN